MSSFRMSALMGRLFRKPRTAPSRKPTPTRLGLEALETREVPAYVSGGALMIEGTDGPDTVYVSETPPTIRFGLPIGVPKVQVVHNGYTQTFSNLYLRDVRFNGRGGNDYFQNSATLFVVADGGSGRDVLSGGPMDDTLIGGTNDDAIYGNGGIDQVWGGQGADEIRGGADNDILAGDGDNDTIRGGPGDDVLYGNDGHDTMYGDNNAGAAGGVGTDQLFGGWGNDTMAGEGGDDYLYGGDGWDVLYGNDGIDWLEAGSAAEPAYGDGVDWNAHVWAVGGTHMSDVDQNASGTCDFLAALAGSANQHYLENNISYEGNYTYAVQLFDPGSNQWITERVRFDGSAATERSERASERASRARHSDRRGSSLLGRQAVWGSGSGHS